MLGVQLGQLGVGWHRACFLTVAKRGLFPDRRFFSLITGLHALPPTLPRPLSIGQNIVFVHKKVGIIITQVRDEDRAIILTIILVLFHLDWHQA